MEKENLSFLSEDFVDWIYQKYILPTTISNYDGKVLVLETPEQENKEYLENFREILIEKISKKKNIEISKLKIEVPNIIEKEIIYYKIEDNLNPNYVFDNFVMGPSNDNAFITSKQVSYDPFNSGINSLFLYGSSGLGKTHLLHAVGNAIKERNLNTKIKYIRSSDFINDFMDSYNNGTTNDVKQKFYDLDVLLIDDIQMLDRKNLDSISRELFNILEKIYQNNKLIIFTSDQPAREMKHLEERIISRLNWGSVSKINAPGYDLRKKILLSKIKNEEYDGISSEVVEYMAKNIINNVRELEGALSTLISHSAMFNQYKITLVEAKKWLSHLTCEDPNQLSVDKIKQVVCEQFDVSVKDIEGIRRQKTITLPRNIVMYLCYKYLKLSYKAIGGYFGGKDHTTIMHSVNKIKVLLTKDNELKNVVFKIESELNL